MDSAQEVSSQSSDSHRGLWKVLAGVDQVDRIVFYMNPSTLFERDTTPKWTECADETIDCTQFDPAIVSCAITFLLCGHYGGYDKTVDISHLPIEEPRNPYNPQIACRAILLHARVYGFAHQHALPDLQYYAAVRMHLTLDPYGDSPAMSRLLEEGLVEAVRYVFTQIPEDEDEADPARNILLKFMSTYHAIMRPHFRLLAFECPEVMTSLSNQMSELLTLREGDNHAAFVRRVHTVETVFGMNERQCRILCQALDDGLLGLSREHFRNIVDQASTRIGITEVEIDSFMAKAVKGYVEE